MLWKEVTIMTMREEQKRVLQAVRHSLAHIREDPWLAQRVLAHVKGEEPMKKRISAIAVLSVILALAVLGTACALFSSQVADFFSRYWNRELGESLQEGKVAQIGESVMIGDVLFTLDEIVYKNRSLYGIGTARPVQDTDVILPMDLAEDPESFLMNEEAQTLAAKAKDAGGRILTTSSMPKRIGVDGGTLLMPGCIGYYDIANGDGSVIFSFEASDGLAVSEGTSYQIEMESTVQQIDESGETASGTPLRAHWTVSCTPVIISASSDRPDAGSAVIEQPGYVLMVPEPYRSTGTLPVCQAIEPDFPGTVDPGWFNASGISSIQGSDCIIFNDHAELYLSRDSLSYWEFSDGSHGESASGTIADLVWIREWAGHAGEFSLERTALTGITLSEAKARAEELISRLGIAANQYVCVDALDMSLKRIRTMGAIWEKAIADGELLTDKGAQPYDYASIPAEEEGFYLKYVPFGIDASASGTRYEVSVYVCSRGIVWANVRNPFSMGETVAIPEKLITSDAAIEQLTEELGRSLSWYDKNIKSVQQAVLTYEAVRADDPADGMVFVPVWLILYQDESAARLDYSCYALINAVDGTLIDAPFR